MDIIRVNDRLSFGGQPTAGDLRALHKQGFRTLVNLRLPVEQMEPEGDAARRAGFAYVHVPVAQADWTQEPFETVWRVLHEQSRGRLFVHSAEGARAGVVTLACHAAEAGWDEDDLVLTGRRLGIDMPLAARVFVWKHSRAYVHRGAG